MDVVYTRCCGLDIHTKTVVACLILSTEGSEPIKELVSLPLGKVSRKASRWGGGYGRMEEAKAIL
jgi:hypothetical protein